MTPAQKQALIQQNIVGHLQNAPRGVVLLYSLYWTHKDPAFQPLAATFTPKITEALQLILTLHAATPDLFADASGGKLHAVNCKHNGPKCYDSQNPNYGFSHTVHISRALQQPFRLLDDYEGAAAADEDGDQPPEAKVAADATLGARFGTWWFAPYEDVFTSTGDLIDTDEDLLRRLGFPFEDRSGQFIVIATEKTVDLLTDEARRPSVFDGPDRPRLKISHANKHNPTPLGTTADIKPLPTLTDGVREAVAPPLRLDAADDVKIKVINSRATGRLSKEDQDFQTAIMTAIPIAQVLTTLTALV